MNEWVLKFGISSTRTRERCTVLPIYYLKAFVTSQPKLSLFPFLDTTRALIESETHSQDTKSSESCICILLLILETPNSIPT